MNGDIPEAAETSKLCVCSTQGRNELQEAGLWADTHRSALLRDWFALSDLPLDYGW